MRRMRRSSSSRTFGIEGANADDDLGALGNDVAGRAAVERADRYHRRVHRMDVARDDRLQRHDDRRAADDGIGRFLRFCSMAAAAVHVDGGFIDRRHDRTFAQGKLAEGQAGLVVKRKDGVAGNWSNSPSSIISLAPPRILLGRLKDQMHGAVEILAFGDGAGSSSSMVVWPSWPQACIRPGVFEA